MQKVIVEFPDYMPPDVALNLVRQVLLHGRVGIGKLNILIYKRRTVLPDGHSIYSRNKFNPDTDSFVIRPPSKYPKKRKKRLA